jgi:hypothetical protein
MPKAPLRIVRQLRFLNHLLGILVLSEPDKFCMPEPISRRPFQGLNLSNGLRTQLDALLHFLGSEFIAPTSSASAAYRVVGLELLFRID